MSADPLDYERLVKESLRGVVRRALEIATRGLPGEHHFYISFNTGAPGVELSDALRARYPGEMTIVLKTHFWELEVRDEDFSVGLSFDQEPQKLTIPFRAIRRFYDPSVPFGLELEIVEPLTLAAAPGPDAQTAEPKPADVLELSRFRKNPPGSRS